MKRRDFIALLGGAASWPLTARAQQKAMPVVGFLSLTIAPSALNSPPMIAFRKGLSETGYVEGQNLAIEFRFAEGKYDQLPAMAADLVGRKVDVTTIPIVFIGVNDPVGLGLVASLAWPGGNLTGFSNMSSELTAKRLELLSELVPQAKVIALLVNPNNPGTNPLIPDLQEAARAKGVQLPILEASNESQIDAAFASLGELHAGALVVGDPFTTSRRDQLVALASRHAVPAIFHLRSFAEAGGLISYGDRGLDSFRQAGSYAGRILKGAKPADLPVQQPSKFDLVVNLKTAKELGLTVPPSILARADEVIE